MLPYSTKLKIVIIISYTSQFSIITIIHRKHIFSVKININNYTINFKGYIAVKLSAWFCG